MKQSIRDLKPRKETEFYEVMPTTANYFPVDDTPLEDEYRLVNKETEKANLVAMVTLAIVMLTTIVVGVLFWRGLEMVKSSLPAIPQESKTAGSSGSLEL